MTETGNTCANCRTVMPAGAAFCPACGQSVKPLSRPWLEFAREMLDELLDYDGRMLRSLRLLLTRPGFLSAEYIGGRRAAYTPPIRLYLVVSLLFFLVLPLILPESTQADSAHIVSVDLYSKAMFLLLPVFALLLKIFYRRGYYLEHLVFAVHLFSAMFIVFGVMLAFEDTADRHLAGAAIQVVLLGYTVWYFLAALHAAYRESWLRSSVKLLALLLLFLPLLGLAIDIASHPASQP